ncbi:Metallo-dependent phosphatase [Anaeromyces robustus]|uniref:Metallo-dependent phosphatase n=1 Tax=Anaeromyces robustus TaxID=1754192 RepID=A0A1Y1WS84_9FUNG|nr:Metallo-dependent phosphatase [Anaeromyces robustus]|eukprot:ORX76400.1 Metallo-dependent phosphatase [Anaeromyces robustus]
MTEVLSANPRTTSVFQEKKEETTTTSLSTSTTTSSSSTISVVVPEGKESKEDKENIPTYDKDDKSSKSSSDKDKRSTSSFKRVVAVGDIHGDYRKLVKVLRTAKLIDHKNNWIAKDTAFIQTGDLLDRGSDTILIFDLMIKLKDQAKKYNSIVYMLLGNHEIMNLQEDFRYVTRGDVMSFGGMANRKKAFSLEGKYGKLLRTEMNATMIIDDTLFVHAGLTSVFAKYGVDQMNNHVHYVLQTYPAEQLFYAPILGNNGPFWTRFMSWGEEQPMCEELRMVFETMNIKRMVVGHTVQENGKINSRCGKKYLMIDVGMSEFYGGRFAYLEFLNDKKEVWAVYSETHREQIN